MTHMQQPIYLYGTPEAPIERVMTVLLIGFDGRRKVLTGTREALWREYLHGDGGPATRAPGNAGYEYWCPLPLGTTEQDAVPGPATLNLLNRGKQ